MKTTFILALILTIICPFTILAEEFIVLFPALNQIDARAGDLHRHFEDCSRAFAKALEERTQAPDSVTYLFVINGAVIDCSERCIKDIADSPAVESISSPFPVYAPTTIDEEISADDNKAEYTQGVALVGAPLVWDEFGFKGKGVVIGHIDTGVNANHEDLKGKVVAFKDFVVPSNTSPNDNGGHGTHTAGTIAGGNSSGRHIGVAPEARLIVAKAIGYGKSSSNLLLAMDWMCDPDGNPETDDFPCGSKLFLALRFRGSNPLLSSSRHLGSTWDFPVFLSREFRSRLLNQLLLLKNIRWHFVLQPLISLIQSHPFQAEARASLAPLKQTSLMWPVRGIKCILLTEVVPGQ